MTSDKLFNLYIRVGENKQIVPTVDLDEIDKIFVGIKGGLEKIQINGRYIDILEYDLFKIYDFSISRSDGRKGDIKREMEHYGRQVRIRWSVQLLKQFGVDVTDKFTVPERKSKNTVRQVEFVDTERINELKRIRSEKFDLARLIWKCEELNITFSQNCFDSVGVLTRSIIDHIPPIFGKANFADVAGSVGNRSFKELMVQLDKSSRKIADSILHSQIREKETLPNKTLVDFKSAIDALLSEIVKVLDK